MKTILGIDIGFGDVKVIFGTSDGKIDNKFKFSSAIGITQRNSNIQDVRIYDYKDHSYYVGDDALTLPSENMVDITQYKNLEYYAPIFLYHAIKKIGKKPDILISGLSKAQLNNSGYFKENLKSFTVNNETMTFDEIYILPQGAGSKLAIDKYGDNFPNPQTEFNGQNTFIGVDIGFNTLDMFLVSNGKTSPTLFEGIEHEGIMKIASRLSAKVKENHGRAISLPEAKEILANGYYKLRGQRHDYTQIIKDIKFQYLKELTELIQNKYGKVLDKSDFVFLSGGGSRFFNSDDNNFFRVPKTDHEFYNAIGFYLFGILRS